MQKTPLDVRNSDSVMVKFSHCWRIYWILNSHLPSPFMPNQVGVSTSSWSVRMEWYNLKKVNWISDIYPIKVRFVFTQRVLIVCTHFRKFQQISLSKTPKVYTFSFHSVNICSVEQFQTVNSKPFIDEVTLRFWFFGE